MVSIVLECMVCAWPNTRFWSSIFQEEMEHTYRIKVWKVLVLKQYAIVMMAYALASETSHVMPDYLYLRVNLPI